MPDRPRLTDDPYLEAHLPVVRRRREAARERERQLTGGRMDLTGFATAHEEYGLHRHPDAWVFTEWAPNAEAVFLLGDFCGWCESARYALQPIDATGNWQLTLPLGALNHGDLFRLRLRWPGGGGDRLPAYARYVIQDDTTKIFNAVVWAPPPYLWKHGDYINPVTRPVVYEAHVGMATQKEEIGTYDAFRRDVLPKIADAGYNTIELMAVMEHPYYASFGYHVGSFFAPSSRFGTPQDLKALIDEAHGLGVSVVMDLIHSHAVRNEVEGLSNFDGTEYQYFHSGDRGWHAAWDSRCFDYSKPEVLRFLLSNCRYWLDEFRVDGFRFDGVTSMLYRHHGLGVAFTSYGDYFNDAVDEDAVTYLALANKLVHNLRSDAMTIAEDVSGMPGLAAPIEDGGCGFDLRLAMGVPDYWFKMIKDVRDEEWSVRGLFGELTNRRADERTISYVECHDQALVGGKTLIFEMLDAEIYRAMRRDDQNSVVDRGLALHKMSRLFTIATAADGYLNFMGNEFGHPDWIDFPREGNNWSYHYARRQWSLRDDPNLKYGFLGAFDKTMIAHVMDFDLLRQPDTRLLYANDEQKVIAFERTGSYFFFNFHPTRSYTDHRVPAPPGEYVLALDTDELRFGGHGRVAADQHYFTTGETQGSERRDSLLLYLPCRTALVLRRRTASSR